MNCIHLKQKMNKTIYCKIKNTKIHFSDCNNCPFKSIRPINSYKQNLNININPKEVNVADTITIYL